MSTTIYVNQDKWQKEMYEDLCKCGHALYLHAFTMGEFDDNSVTLHTSQCTFCPYDKEKERFACEGYERVL